jgi:hypothetical protein
VVFTTTALTGHPSPVKKWSGNTLTSCNSGDHPGGPENPGLEAASLLISGYQQARRTYAWLHGRLGAAGEEPLTEAVDFRGPTLAGEPVMSSRGL